LGAVADFFEVASRQRAHRRFRDAPVDRHLVRRVLEAATYAPSAENLQPWRFVVVTDRGCRRRIGELTRRAWERGAERHASDRLPPTLLRDVRRGATGGVAAAPVLIVVGAETTEVPASAADASIWPAVQNLLLAAGALGLGAALTTLPTVFGEELSSLVGFPSTVTPKAVVPLGWPERDLGAPRRRGVDEVAGWDHFTRRLPGSEG
jgi:nitroreductase